MPKISVKQFSGSIPVKGDRALPDGFAAESFNTWLYGDELRGAHPPVDLIAIQTATRRVFRVPKGTVGGDPTFPGVVPPPSYLGDSVWMQFTDHDTDIVRGQLVADTNNRWYFCSKTTGPMFNTYARMVSGLSPYKLGVPGPNVDIGTGGTNPDKPTITSITGGAAPVLTRAYLYTWVNEFGEESAPSLPVVGAGNANAVWNIGNIKAPPTLGANYPLYTKKRLYRTITGTSGDTTYYLVTDTIPLATLTYADDTNVMTDAVLAQQLRLTSTTWDVPPANLEGWIAMPNGFLIGWADSTIYMSEAYHFHAWPAEYAIAAEYPIVGLGVLGQTCVVCTEGFPATISGASPASCSFTKATTGEPCLSRGGIVATPEGVIYPSQNGLVMVAPGGISNVTSQIITRDEWLRVYQPAYIRAVRYQNGYLALRMKDAPGQRSMFFLDPTELRVALTEFTDFQDCRSLNVDYWSGEVFVINEGMIRRWDPPTNDLMPIIWKSKEYQFPYQENFGAYSIYWDDARYSSYNFGLSVMPTTERVRFRAYADRKLVYDQVVQRNGRPIRLPSGFKSDIWSFEIRSRAPIYSMHVASTMKELRDV